MTTSTLKIASIQLCSQTNIDQNLAIISQAVQEAAKHGAKFIVLPENACVMGRQGELAQRFDEMVVFFQTLAKTHQVHLLAGTLPCPYRPDGSNTQERFRQSSLLFDDSGKQIARYDKIHLFRATVNDSTGNYDEGRTFEAGDKLVVAPCLIDGMPVNIGLTICFDARFPSLAQRLRQQGADIITVPAAFTHQTGQAHWQLLLQARALDSQCLMIGATQGGTHYIGDSTRQTWGHAMMVNAHGQMLVSTDSTEVGAKGYLVCYADFDKAFQDSVRQRMPIFDCHRLA